MCGQERVRRRLSNRGDCVCCPGIMEDLDHLFRRCNRAVQVWEVFLPSSVLYDQSRVMFDEWLKLNLTGRVHSDFTQDWSAMFVIILWWLWRWRNDLVFNNRVVSLEFKIGWLKSQIRGIEDVMGKSSLVSNAPLWTAKFVSWTPPPDGWFKLNVDGCSKGSDQAAGCGGILCDKSGEWVKAFTCKIGSCNAVEAELWAVYQGLRLAWIEGFRKVILESDSAMVVRWMNEGDVSNLTLRNLLQLCMSFLRKDWEVKILHVYREQNRVADLLAKLSTSSDRGMEVLVQPPLGVIQALVDDQMTRTWSRRVCRTLQ
ncbi:hypothetical protein PTKIN_Ptkin01aG0141200 [Pterospermum kingtungense]